MLPLCRTPLAALATLEFIWVYNDFFWALLLIQKGDRLPITSGLNNLKGQFAQNYNLTGGRRADVGRAGADRLPGAAAAVRRGPDPRRQQGMTTREMTQMPILPDVRNAMAADLRQRTERHAAAMAALSAGLGGQLAFGGDYNPEQWSPRGVARGHRADAARPGSTWSRSASSPGRWLEPKPGVFEFGWLDRILDLLHAGGIRVDLANASATPPPWFSHQYPDSLPVDIDGVRRSYGARQAFCPSSAGLPGGRGRTHLGHRRALRRSPGRRHVARTQRVRLPQRGAATATPRRRRSVAGCSVATAISTS